MGQAPAARRARGPEEGCRMPETSRPADAAGSAMLRAVVAEQDARETIAAAEVQAATDIDAARTRARAILDAVPERIERLRLRGERAVQRALARIHAEEQAALAALDQGAFPEERIGPATAAVAARLAGSEPS
jgi:hypothetical protein